nr:carboxypeptidase regulatory-like domain-containing protein [Prauserella isguenensis]
MRARALGGQQPTTVLSGVVQGGNRPLADVTVTVTDRTGSQCARAATDASGVFRVSGLEPGSYVLVFARAGYRPQATVVPPGPMPSRLDITLEPTAGVGGTIRERIAGRPIPGATVTAIGAAGEVITSTVSGEDGAYHLGGVDAPQITLVVAAPLADPVATVVTLDEGPVTDVDLELELRGALTGVVTSGGWPLSGVRLLLRGADGAVVSSTVTDDGGRYRFGAVAPGNYTVTTAPAAPCVQTVGPNATLADLRVGAELADAGSDRGTGPVTEVFSAVPPQAPRGG